jgi:spore coat protein CotF
MGTMKIFTTYEVTLTAKAFNAWISEYVASDSVEHFAEIASEIERKMREHSYYQPTQNAHPQGEEHASNES